MISVGGWFAGHHLLHLDSLMVLLRRVKVWSQVRQVQHLDARCVAEVKMANHGK